MARKETTPSKLKIFLTTVYAIIVASPMMAAAGSAPKCAKTPHFLSSPALPVTTESTPFSGSKLYRPNDNRKHLSILLLHGSEGGSAKGEGDLAKMLAAMGYSVMTYCYFDCNRKPGAPSQTMKNIEATKALDAVDWLRQQPFSDSKVAVYGGSRGAEFTMIVGSLNGGKKMPDALIAHSPSDKFNEPFNKKWEDQSCWICKTGNCSKQSHESAYAWDAKKCGGDNPDKMDHNLSAWKINGVPVPDDARIPVENFKGPILITVGDKDKVWPVDQTHNIEATLKKSGQSPEVYYFHGEGHNFNAADSACETDIVASFLKGIDSAPAAAPVAVTTEPETVN